MTIVEERPAVTGGVDTHSEVHVAAALDPVGGLLGTLEFPATATGYASLLGWLGKFGDVALVGVEGTGSYGAGLARYFARHGVRVVEVDRADRQDRHRSGKSDPLDAVSAARAALSGRASGAPKGRDGAVEAIRVLMVAKRSARHERTTAINQARALILTGPTSCGPGSPGSARPASPRRWPRCGPGRVTLLTTRCASRCASSAGAWSFSTLRLSGWTS
jgi:transposase